MHRVYTPHGIAKRELRAVLDVVGLEVLGELLLLLVRLLVTPLVARASCLLGDGRDEEPWYRGGCRSC